MDKANVRRVKAGDITLADLSSTDPVYVTGLSDFYEGTKYFTNSYGTFECGMQLPEQPRFALVEKLKNRGITQKDYKQFSTGISPGDLFKQLLTVDQIGFKRAILFTIAIKNQMPPTEEIFACVVREVLFEGSSLEDTSDELYNLRSNRLGDRDTRLVTKMAQSVALEMAETLISGSKDLKMLPTAERITELVFASGVEFFDNGRYCMSKRIYWAESEFFRLTQTSLPRDRVVLTDYEASMLDDDQKRGLVGLLQAPRASCVQGQPGAGKTSTIDALLHHLTEEEIFCATAWANKACDVLTDRFKDYKLGKDDRVKNILSLFYRLDNPKFRETLKRVKYLVVDEASMIGSRALYYVMHILAHCHPECRLVLTGDINQLPPVKEYGQPFKLAVGLEKQLGITVFHLTQYHRSEAEGIFQAFSSLMSAGMHTIRRHEDGTVSLAKAMTETIAVSKVAEDIVKLERSKQCVFSVAETNALCDAINLKVTRSLFGDSLTVRRFDPTKTQLMAKHIVPNKVGMHVVSLHNIRNGQGELLWSNGEMGRVTCSEDGEVTIRSDLKHIERTFTLRQVAEHFQMAYCASVFKFEGSESDTVLYLFNSDKNLNGYSLFHKIREQKYVALSRPRKHLRIVAVCSNLDEEFKEVDSLTIAAVDTPMPKSYILSTQEKD